MNDPDSPQNKDETQEAKKELTWQIELEKIDHQGVSTNEIRELVAEKKIIQLEISREEIPEEGSAGGLDDLF